MKTFISISFLFFFGLLNFFNPKSKQDSHGELLTNQMNQIDKVENPALKPISNQTIQVALLLDTSNSMDGLIEQAKSRLWNIINTLTTLKYNGETPNIEISLYEYGNDRLNALNNYIKQITPLTSDLDLISEKLFALKTQGGSEFCGAVISNAKNTLEWKDGKNDMKLIYIAGNEPFDQGPIQYSKAIQEAVEKNIYINTILCGRRGAEEISGWKNGASLGKGQFFIIDSDQQVRFIDTPYDVKIGELNIELNKTYMGYGSKGQEKKQNQFSQDSNAESQGHANMAERAISKSKKVYNNASWDIVDKYIEDDQVISTLKDEELPVELQNKTEKEMRKIIDSKIQDRNKIQKEINALSIVRQSYIEKKMTELGEENDLGAAMKQSILELAKKMGYTVAK